MNSSLVKENKQTKQAKYKTKTLHGWLEITYFGVLNSRHIFSFLALI